MNAPSVPSLAFSTPFKTDSKRTVLVLSGYEEWYPAMLFNIEGDQEELGCFEADEKTEARFACSVNWQNQFHIFGGSSERRQISRLSGYKLQRIGNLSFDHVIGACSVMNNQFIFLCFHVLEDDGYRRCRRSTGPLEVFSSVALSNHDHPYTSTSCSESKLFREKL